MLTADSGTLPASLFVIQIHHLVLPIRKMLMNNQKIKNIVQFFKIFIIEILTARAGMHLKQDLNPRG